MPNIEIIPILADNYTYLIDNVLCVDPGDDKPFKGPLKAILLTHHHADHIAGVSALKERCQCPIIGPDDPRIPADTIATPGQDLTIENITFQILSTPGHTKTHISYYAPALKSLYCGDTLFASGCGRLLEGTAQEMLSSLQKIAELPDETLIFCGHEYTLKNLEFALSIEPNNPLLIKRFAHARALRDHNQPTIPTTLELEKETNPFLRCHTPELKTAFATKSDLETFTTLREQKDEF